MFTGGEVTVTAHKDPTRKTRSSLKPDFTKPEDTNRQQIKSSLLSQLVHGGKHCGTCGFLTLVYTISCRRLATKCSQRSDQRAGEAEDTELFTQLKHSKMWLRINKLMQRSGSVLECPPVSRVEDDVTRTGVPPPHHPLNEELLLPETLTSRCKKEPGSVCLSAVGLQRPLDEGK